MMVDMSKSDEQLYKNVVEEIDQHILSRNKKEGVVTPNKKSRYVSSSTGVRELDVVLGGGFPKGAVVLLTGSSGSGKTILSFQWIFEGVKCGERGVYVTLTEPVFKLLENLEKL
ncbi:MAG: hypothetical protein DRN12_08080, partial [Thermoplasmata archaeon]